jgi:ATP/maltotriose-dependent transcriptional regulator MalT
MIESVASRIVSPDLVGRETELRTIAAAVNDAGGGRARTILLAGEAGIGKSRILGEALRRASSEAVVLQGGCIGLAEGSLPFGPIVEALRPLLRELEASERHRAEGTAGDQATNRALSAVAAELGLLSDRPSATSPGAELRPEWTRSRMYEAFLDLLRRLAADRPVILAIEDLHWADDSTRELLAFLIRNAQAERLLLIITFRSDELNRRHPLLFWLAEVDRAAGVERIELRRLDRDLVARQLAAILGHSPAPSLITSVFERSEGNPFFAEELIAAGAESHGLPPTLREVLAARLAHVSEQTMQVLGVAAVIGRKVDHDLLALVADLSDRDLFEALQEALSSQLLIVEETPVTERYAFRHALTAEAAAETVLPSQRRRLHVVIAEALEGRPHHHGAEKAGRLAEIAHHWFEARDQPKALAASLKAADAALKASAFVEAYRQYRRVIELWDVVPEPETVTGIDRVELLRRTAQAGQMSGEFMQAAGLLREAIDLLEAAGNSVRAGVFYERLGRALWTSARIDDALAAYQTAMKLVPEEASSADRARVLAGYAQALMLRGRYADSRPIAEAAMALAQSIGLRQIEGHAAATLGVDIAFVEDADAGIELTNTALLIAEETRDSDDIGRAYACLSSILDLDGRIEESLRVSTDGYQRLRELGLAATYGAFVQMNHVDGLIAIGDWDEALAETRAAEPVARGNVRVFANIQLARLTTMRGDFDAAERALDHAMAKLGVATESQFNGPLAVTRLEYALLLGELDDARNIADSAQATLEETEDNGAIASVISRSLRVEADLAERARAARDNTAVEEAADRARRLAGRLRQLDTENLSPGFRKLVQLSIKFGEAELSRVEDRPDPQLWAAAVAAADERPVVYDAAYARYRQAEALLAGRSDREAATRLLVEARASLVRIGARPLLDAVGRLVARTRLALDATNGSTLQPDVAEPAGIAAYDLTARELEVLRLVAAGRTNRQIGEELFISESTAGVHVSRILGKFGVSGRVEAATIATRLGLDQ